MKNENIYQEIINHFGADTQIDKIQEEAQELALVLHQMKCPTKNKTELLEQVYSELADMTIMLRQARLLFDSEKIDYFVKYKLQKCQDKYLNHQTDES